MIKRRPFSVTVADEAGAEKTFHGRPAWALAELIRAGETGCTPIDNPGPRWSAYVHKLRHDGLNIETRHEAHRGPFPGSHARYILHTPLRIIHREAA